MADELVSNLNNMLHACAQQARWHHEQYQRLEYCQRYFTYLLQHRQQFDEHHLEKLLQNLSTGVTQANTQDNTEERGDETTVGMMDCADTTISPDHTVSPARKKKKKRKTKVKASSSETVVERESESGLDLDDGFKEFLRESARFRAERDSQKKLHTTSEDPQSNPVDEEVVVEYVDILRKGPDGSTLPPTAQNRKILYEEKYGDSGTTILSLETALQWKHNKFVDTTSPITWPALQLRLVYDDR